MLDKQSSWNDIQPRAKRALRDIRGRFNQLYRSSDGREGWGQYLNPPTHRNHTGIYGTGSGVQVLSTADSEIINEQIKSGQNWLIHQWSQDDSETKRSGYNFLTYKYAFCLFGLSPHDTVFLSGRQQYDNQYDDTVDEFFEGLWERRIGTNGWAKYCLEEAESLEPDLQSSAFAALSLLGSQKIRNKPDFEEILKSIGERAYQEGKTIDSRHVGNGTKSVLTISLCLLALSRYKNIKPDNSIQKQTEIYIDRLSDVITSQVGSGNNFDKNTYSISLVSLPNSDRLPDDVVLDHYVIFLVYPIVVLALLEAGSPYIGRNHVFIRNVVSEYVNSTIDSDVNCFSSSNTGRCSTHDHLWIATMINKFVQTDIDEESRISRFRGHFQSRYVASLIFGAILLSIAIIASLFDQPANSATVRAISALTIALIGAVLGGLEPVTKARERINRFMSNKI